MLRSWVFLAVIFAGLVCILWRGGEGILAVVKQSSSSEFISGATFNKIDKVVVQALPKSARLDGFVAGLMYAGLHDAGPQVWAGCDDWLFLADELRSGRRDLDNIKARARLYLQIAAELKQRGILLVVLPVPDKAGQLDDKLCGLSADASRLRAQKWSRLKSPDGLTVVDVLKGWPRPGYWRTDTHWDRHGSKFAAQAVANALINRGSKGTDAIVLQRGEQYDRVGDLTRLAGLADAPSWLAPAPEPDLQEIAELKREGSLLDDVPPPSLILTGSSFSLNSGFVDYLQVSLSREIVQLVEPGSGFAGALLEILETRPKILGDVKVVIWEWPMRSLTEPITDVERRFLARSPDEAIFE